MKIKNVSQLFSLFLIGIVFTGCKEEKPEVSDKPVNVKVFTIGNKVAFNPISFSGTITADKSVTLTFQVSGTVQDVKVSKGDFVEKGTVIATIDPIMYQSRYDAQKAQASLAKENYNRILEVFKKGSIAEIKMLDAKSKFEQASAAAKATKEQLSYTVLRASMDGYVSDKLIESGDLASPGIPVVTLEKIETVKAQLPIPDNEINSIKNGDTVHVKVPVLDNKQFKGYISDIAVASNAGTPLYTAAVTLNNVDNLLKPGMVCNAYFKKDTQKNTSIIPMQSIIVDNSGNKFVYVVIDGKAMKKNVETGKLYDNGIEVITGISRGDKVVTSGYHKLTDDTMVKIIE